MKPEITPEEYELLPPRRKRFYEFDKERNLWVLRRADYTLAVLLFLTFSAAAGGYVNEQGQRVSDRNIRNRFKLASDDLAFRFMNAAREFMAGDPSPEEQAEFLRRNQARVEEYYRAAARIGLGNAEGTKLLEDVAVRRQMRYYTRFIEEVAEGKKLNPGRFGMYGRAIYTVFENVNRFLQQQAGRTEERRVLGVAEHCDEDEGELKNCVDQAARGWQPIGTLPPLGQSPCLTNCRCHFEFR